MTTPSGLAARIVTVYPVTREALVRRVGDGEFVQFRFCVLTLGSKA